MYAEPQGPQPPQGGGAWLGPIGALAGLAGSMYDSYQNRKTSRENTDKSIAANKAEAELAYQRSLDMWNMQNAYNSPQAQMQRFQAAGLNPHLIYGQGNAGNASGAPQYQRPDIQYRYEAAPYGSAVQGVLPMLMSVASWMQDMRAKELDMSKTRVDILRGTTETEKAREVLAYLKQANPKLLSKLGFDVDYLQPLRAQQAGLGVSLSRSKLQEMAAEFRTQYGDELFRSSGMEGAGGAIGGIQRLKFLQEQSATKLKEAQASWADMDVTNPQAIMMMVLNGVMGLAGASLRNVSLNRVTQQRNLEAGKGTRGRWSAQSRRWKPITAR